MDDQEALTSIQIPHLSVIMISSSPRPLPLHKTGVPYIYFPPYTRAEAIHLVTQGGPPVPEAATDIRVDDLKKLYVQFAVTVYDSLVSATSSTSIRSFRILCQKLWPRFIWPAISGELPSEKTKATAWDFARLLIRNRTLFQIEGETALIDRLQPVATACTFRELRIQSQTHAPQKKALPTSTAPVGLTTSGQLATASAMNATSLALPPLLKHFATILLLSSYLASHTLTKNDIVLFSRLSSSTKRVRKYRTPKKSIFKSPSKTPTKAASTVEGGGGGNADTAGTPSGMTKNMLGRTRTLFDLKFGAPKGFSLERVVAILRAVHPDGFKHTRSVADRVHREMGELERLRLIERLSADDVVEEGGRWKIAVGREVVEGMLVGWGVKGGVGEWELQGEE
jgi:origin recognition complex subunit 5